MSTKIIVALGFFLHNSAQWAQYSSIEEYDILFPELPISYGKGDPFPSYTWESKEDYLGSRGIRRDTGSLCRFFCTWTFSGCSSPGSHVKRIKHQGLCSPERQLCYRASYVLQTLGKFSAVTDTISVSLELDSLGMPCIH